MLGTLLMIPLRRSLIVKEHETFPIGRHSLRSVLKAGEKGGDFAKAAFQGWALPLSMRWARSCSG